MASVTESAEFRRNNEKLSILFTEIFMAVAIVRMAAKGEITSKQMSDSIDTIDKECDKRLAKINRGKHETRS